MTDAQDVFSHIGSSLPDSEQGQLFGKPCFKVGGKAYVCFFEDEMVFKLAGDAHAEALSLDGSQLFDPSGKHRPMKEWVQVPFAHQGAWPRLAASAQAYVSGR